MTGLLSGWRPAARLARREARRRPWRTLLVVVLVGLPVAALTAVLITGRVGLETPEQQASARFGRADVSVTQFGTGTWFAYEGEDAEYQPPPSAADMEDVVGRAVGNATDWVVLTFDHDAVVDDDGRLTQVTNIAGDFDDPLLEGKFAIAGGRFPTRSTEAAVSKQVADDEGIAIGESISLFRLGEVTVVGIAWVPDADHRQSVLLAERGVAHLDGRATAYVTTDGYPEVTAPDWRDAGGQGPVPVTADDEVLDGLENTYVEGPFDATALEAQHRDFLTGAYVMAGLVLLAAAIVSSAAFAVGARRQLRTMGLLAANGADDRVLRMAVLFQGTVAGVVGSVAGIAVAVVGSALLHPYMDDIAGRPVNDFAVLPIDVTGAFALGVLASTAAAFIPSRSAARVPVLAALAGRRPQQRVPNSVPVRGLVVTGSALFGLTLWSGNSSRTWTAGLALAVTATLGTIAISPWLVGLLEGAASRTSGALRLAARGLARNRVRSGAVVAGILAPMALAVFGTTAAATTAPNDAGPHPLGDERMVLAIESPEGSSAVGPEASAEMAAALGGARVVDVMVVQPRPDAVDLPPQLIEVDGHLGVAAIATPELLDVLEASTATRQALASHGAVRVFEPYRDHTDAYPAAEGHDPAMAALAEEAPSVPGGIRQVHAGAGEVILLVAPEAVPNGRVPIAAATVFEADHPISSDQVQAVVDLAHGDGQSDAALRAYLLGRPFQGDGVMIQAPTTSSGAPFGMRAAAVLGSLLVTLAVVAITLALNAAEEREDDAVLAAVGAPPALRRSIRAWQAALLPAMAAVLAIPLGVLACSAVLREALVVPTATLAAIGLGVPLVAGVAARLVASITLRRPAPISWLLPV